MISYFKDVRAKALDLTEEVFNKMLDSAWIAKRIEEIRKEEDADKRGQMKKSLPAITWQSHFPVGASRSNKGAEPTGLFILDYDHVENPLKWWEEHKSKIPSMMLVCAHVTPSGKGIRLVLKNLPQVSSIEQQQEALSKTMEAPDYDKACKDFARLSFMVSRGDILYLNLSNIPKNDEIFIQNPEREGDIFSPVHSSNSASSPLPANNQSNGSGSGNSVSSNGADNGNNGQTRKSIMYKPGISYETIVSELVDAMGGEPQEGTRNNFCYRLARKLRYIVDFSSAKLFQIIPRFGLPENEVVNLCQSACKSARSEKIPYDLWLILQRLESGEKESEDESEDNDKTEVNLPPLPPIFKQFCRIAPDDFKVPTIFALLPVLGTLASRLRADYIDGETHAPNFTCVIEAPQASGKSFARRIVKTCMGQIEYLDSISRVKEQQYLMQLKKSKNSKNQPEEPVAIIRMIPASVSIAKLLKRLANAKGLHLFSFLEELDTLTKSNKAGAWSQKTDIYRNAFDNADYGQEYMSENSYSGIFPVFYNMLTCGTPAAVSRFYKDPEDGLVSRVIFCQLPSQFGAKMPIFKKLTSFERRMIENKCSQMNDELCCTPEQEVVKETKIDLGYLNKAIGKWNEKQRRASIEEVSISRNTFYRRSAVIGFRAGMVAHYLYKECNKKTKADVIKFALFVADYVLSNLLNKFGESLEKQHVPMSRNIHVNVFNELPDVFERNDVITILKRQMKNTPARNVLSQWKAAGYIEKIKDGKFKKTKK